MIIEFVFGNYRSFKKECRLSMVATSIKEHRKALLPFDKMDMLPASVVYGANSSGKSNILRAMALMKSIIKKSVRLNPSDYLDYDPFLLDEGSKNRPTLFELTFTINNIRYRYGFEYNKRIIVNEWLYEKIIGQREYNLYVRSEKEFDISEKLFNEGIGKEQSTADNRLFLSLVAQLNGEKSKQIMSWLLNNFNIISGLSTEKYEGETLSALQNHDEQYNKLQNFYRHLQLGFKELTFDEVEINEDILASLPPHVKQIMAETNSKSVFEVNAHHNIYDGDGNVVGEVLFNKDESESEGTKKIIELSGPIFDTLNHGKTLVVDELDAKLHPFMTRSILQLFMDPKTNPQKAQLIFATHDTHLLDLAYLRRDQIWFTEKDDAEASDLYSLIEFKDENGNKVRNDSSWEKNYINGRYGAIPFLN